MIWVLSGTLLDANGVTMIDWKEAPKEARWWAMNANGQAHWFLGPEDSHLKDSWCLCQVPAPSFGFSGDWKYSLTERPEA